MVLFAGARKFKAELHGTFASLCDDPQPQVRATLACGFHEVSSTFKNQLIFFRYHTVLCFRKKKIIPECQVY